MDRLSKGGACTKLVPLGQATGTSTTCPSGTSRLAQVALVPVGQAQPVPVGQAYWNRLCLSQWDKQAGCTKPDPLGLKEVKRDLSLCHGTSHIPTMEAFPCAMAQALYHDGACTCSTCANLCHKVGLQGRAIFHGRVDPLCGTSWDKWNWDNLHRGYRACHGTRKGLQCGYMTCPMEQGEVSFDLSQSQLGQAMLVPLGQAQLVPICLSHWDRLYLSQWLVPVGQARYRHHPSKVSP